MRKPEPTADEDFRTIVAELEKAKAELRSLKGIKSRPIPEAAARSHVERVKSNRAAAPIPFHLYAELLRDMSAAKQFRQHARSRSVWAKLSA